MSSFLFKKYKNFLFLTLMLVFVVITKCLFNYPNKISVFLQIVLIFFIGYLYLNLYRKGLERYFQLPIKKENLDIIIISLFFSIIVGRLSFSIIYQYDDLGYFHVVGNNVYSFFYTAVFFPLNDHFCPVLIMFYSLILNLFGIDATPIAFFNYLANISIVYNIYLILTYKTFDKLNYLILLIILSLFLRPDQHTETIFYIAAGTHLYFPFLFFSIFILFNLVSLNSSEDTKGFILYNSILPFLIIYSSSLLTQLFIYSIPLLISRFFTKKKIREGIILVIINFISFAIYFFIRNYILKIPMIRLSKFKILDYFNANFNYIKNFFDYNEFTTGVIIVFSLIIIIISFSGKINLHNSKVGGIIITLIGGLIFSIGSLQVAFARGLENLINSSRHTYMSHMGLVFIFTGIFYIFSFFIRRIINKISLNWIKFTIQVFLLFVFIVLLISFFYKGINYNAIDIIQNNITIQNKRKTFFSGLNHLICSAYDNRFANKGQIFLLPDFSMNECTGCHDLLFQSPFNLGELGFTLSNYAEMGLSKCYDKQRWVRFQKVSSLSEINNAELILKNKDIDLFYKMYFNQVYRDLIK